MRDDLAAQEKFRQEFGVSRETIEQLSAYVSLLEKWNRSINLVSRSTIPEVWGRHIIDSAQLWGFVKHRQMMTWLDVGSGGGLPAIVIAIMAKGTHIPINMNVVESDTRKCVFLRTVVRELGLSVEIHQKRIEELSPLKVDILSARAFTNLSDLLALSARHCGENSTSLFLKGQSYSHELTEAQKSWHIEVESCQSLTDSAARILKIKGIPVAKTA